MKLTRQGVRDLGGGRQRNHRVEPGCPHVWERAVGWEDCMDVGPRRISYYRRGMCKEERL